METKMKLEIEITEDEIKSAVSRRVRTAIADQANQWSVDTYIKDQVAKQWKATVENLVAEYLNDSPAMREKIVKSIEAAQLSAAMKNAA
jgi:predicted SnoaL-like aldol condensation-catalyzing enzyme